MYARTNKCYNERGSGTNYVRFSIPNIFDLDWNWMQTNITDADCFHNGEIKG